jgi:hypothetical protein
MRPSAPAPRSTVLALMLLTVAGAAQALSCEELRSAIEASIRDKGVGRFKVAIVDAGASVGGQVVGNCERGAKKLVYTQQAGADAGANPALPRPKPAAAQTPAVITECADGRVITQGNC